MNNKYKILFIEDEPNIRRFMTALLEANDYRVFVAKRAADGFMMFSSHVPDLIILDLGLPDCDGTEVLRNIRKISDVPVIVLSARSDERDKVNALDMGANDYVTKPFGSAELLARIRNILRISYHSGDKSKTTDNVFSSGGMTIDYAARTLYLDGNEIKLTHTEFNIIALLSEHCGKVLTYSTIIRKIWGASDSGSVKRLQVNMANIRRKLSLTPGENKYISTELGLGYRMNCQE